MMEIIRGKIKQMNEDGSMVIHAQIPDIFRAIKREYEDVEIGLPDGRQISPEQRRLIYALLKYISEWQGDLPENVKRLMKMEFIVNRQQALAKRLFSLSDVDVTTAKEFCNYLIEFCIENRVPTNEPLYEMAYKSNDISRYVYKCLLEKVCTICGRHGELHHVDAVGAGNDRTQINHIGLRALCLCRQHHMESHQRGQIEFCKLYHLEPVAIDEKIAKAYKLKRR